MVLSTTFNNISVILWRSVLLEEETRVPRENHRPNQVFCFFICFFNGLFSKVFSTLFNLCAPPLFSLLLFFMHTHTTYNFV